jgi:hypothetical protein
MSISCSVKAWRPRLRNVLNIDPLNLTVASGLGGLTIADLVAQLCMPSRKRKFGASFGGSHDATSSV